MDKNLVLRLFGGALYGLVVIMCTTPVGANWINSLFPDLVRSQSLYYGLITFFLFVGAWECVKMMKFDPKGWEKWVVFPLTALVFYHVFSKRYFNYGYNFNFNLSELFGILLIIIAVVTLFRFAQELYYDNGKLIFTVIYTVLPFGFALGLPRFGAGNAITLEVFFLFVLIWSSDSFAFFTGKFFGKHKMAPKISPKKTWEGFAGGVILTVVAGIFIEMYHPELRGNYIIVAFLVAVFAPLGDLVESKLKRNFAVKDSGNIIPGHGGILDRLDSFIICAPVVYLYFILEKLV